MAKCRRTKEQMASDVAFILNAPLHFETKKAVLNNVLWSWTEFEGKYKGCKYWTPAAIEHFKAHKAKGLRHEHVVPRKLVISMLIELEAMTPEMVYEMLERLAIGAVVTKDEERLLNEGYKSEMPDEFHDPDDPGFQNAWLRFARINLNVVEAN